MTASPQTSSIRDQVSEPEWQARVDLAAAEAFLSMFLLERACKIQILAQSGRGELVRIPGLVIRLVESQVKAVTVGQGAALTWPGLLRKLDRLDPSYKE